MDYLFLVTRRNEFDGVLVHVIGFGAGILELVAALTQRLGSIQSHVEGAAHLLGRAFR